MTLCGWTWLLACPSTARRSLDRLMSGCAAAAIDDAEGRPRLPISDVPVVTRLYEVSDRRPDDSDYCEDGCRDTVVGRLAFARNHSGPERRAVEERVTHLAQSRWA